MSNRSRDEDILHRIRSGDSIYDVSIHYDLTPQRIGQIVKSLTGENVVDARGYHLQRGNYKVDDAAIERLFKSGLTTTAIAVHLNVGLTTVNRSLRRSGYEVAKAAYEIRRPAWLKEAQAALDAGMTLAEAAKAVKRTYANLRYHVLTGRLRTDSYEAGAARVYVDRERAEALLDQGYSWPAIAAMLNVPLNTLRSRALADGWYRVGGRRTKRVQIVAEMQADPGASTRDIADRLGVSITYVRDVARSN